MPACKCHTVLSTEYDTVVWIVRGARWRWNNEYILKVLSVIETTPAWRYALFTRSVIKPTIWTVTREINLKIFEDDVGWYEEMKARGLVKRSKGKIVPTDQWTSATSDPVYSLITRLKKWIREGKIRDEIGIELDPTWKDFSDLPKHIRASFKSAYPYYFLLNRLMTEHAPYATNEVRATKKASRSNPARTTAAATTGTNQPSATKPLSKRSKALKSPEIVQVKQEVIDLVSPEPVAGPSRLPYNPVPTSRQSRPRSASSSSSSSSSSIISSSSSSTIYSTRSVSNASDRSSSTSPPPHSLDTAGQAQKRRRLWTGSGSGSPPPSTTQLPVPPGKRPRQPRIVSARQLDSIPQIRLLPEDPPTRYPLPPRPKSPEVPLAARPPPTTTTNPRRVSEPLAHKTADHTHPIQNPLPPAVDSSQYALPRLSNASDTQPSHSIDDRLRAARGELDIETYLNEHEKRRLARSKDDLGVKGVKDEAKLRLYLETYTSMLRSNPRRVIGHMSVVWATLPCRFTPWLERMVNQSLELARLAGAKVSSRPIRMTDPGVDMRVMLCGFSRYEIAESELGELKQIADHQVTLLGFLQIFDKLYREEVAGGQ